MFFLCIICYIFKNKIFRLLWALQFLFKNIVYYMAQGQNEVKGKVATVTYASMALGSSYVNWGFR